MSDLSTGFGPGLDTDAPARGAGLSLLLKHAEQAVRLRLQPVLDEHGLTYDHWRILAVLELHPGLTMSTIADAAVVPAATLTRLVDRLTEIALVVRRIDRADKRRALVALSPRGTDVAAALRVVEDRVSAEVAAALGADRAEALHRDLAVLAHVVDA
ncbi:MarR family winged helix-turn-helix transcriptional regulator [Nocardioides jejuensis]|uniref:MarR family transcriptional regulator n=1 Tax=Nocardioides jejuensis TaxID=2502782 RepID=A0A4R1BZ26_9ACTN|nr:MarR family transcriptional regulator [Nocardioides jejuensis]TCJ23373.1 MarR family transcriptional regulator [Nocardioides jejuensis]